MKQLIITIIVLFSTWTWGHKIYHTLYHGCAKHQYINFLLNTYLDAHVYQRPLQPHFLKLRHTDHLYPHSIYNIQQYINAQNIDDHDETYQTHLLATSPAAPSSDDTGVEDAIKAAHSNASITDIKPQHIIDQYEETIPEHQRIRLEHITQKHIHDMYTRSSRTGVLLRIAIDRIHIPACVFLARPCGTPAYCNMPGSSPTNTMIRDFLDLYSENQFEAVQTYCSSLHRNALRACKTLQTRILLQKRLFDHPGYVRIHAYHDIPQDVLDTLAYDIKQTLW